VKLTQPTDKGLGILATISIISILLLSATCSPASAIVVDTKVTISSGGGSLPVVMCIWQEDLTSELEDGDPAHNDPMAQFLPPCTYEGVKTVQNYDVVTDEEDNGNMKLVFADVYHPDGTPKYQVPMTKLPKPDSIALFEAAEAASLVWYDHAVGQNFNYDDILFKLNKCTAEVWMGEADLDYHQMAGDYRVEVYCVDNNNLSEPLINTFLYVPVACCEFDFTSVSYGSVRLSVNKWIAGDTNFETTNRPTVRNIGNVPCLITVRQDDMDFGQDSTGQWNIRFDAKLGNTGTTVAYNPYVTVTLPDPLDNCHTEELDFSIHIKKGFGERAGEMILGCTEAN